MISVTGQPDSATTSSLETRIAIRAVIPGGTTAWAVIENFPVAALGDPDAEIAALSRLRYNNGFEGAPIVIDAVPGFAAGCSTWSDHDNDEEPCTHNYETHCDHLHDREHAAEYHWDCQHALFGTDPAAVDKVHLAATSTGILLCACPDVIVQDDDTLPHHLAHEPQFTDGQLLPEHRPLHGLWLPVLDPSTLHAAGALEQWHLRTGPYGHREYGARVTRPVTDPDRFTLAVTSDDRGPLDDVTTEHDTAEQARIHGARAIHKALTRHPSRLEPATF